jgi:nucleoside-diphosphate-sugar epimerase
MKILIAGNMGYVGPVVVKRLRESYPDATLIGFDSGFFAHCLTACELMPECQLNAQYFGDVRRLPEPLLDGIDAVVYLAAISNDPMGAQFEKATMEVNQVAASDIAKKAKLRGARSFVFASSCSVYGFAEGGARTEDSAVNPLTAYARSKVGAEQELSKLSNPSFAVTCLRFATACGMSDRLRLDLVLNDFVANALASKKITILSDGTPWRPLIHVQDMARAIDWAIRRPVQIGGSMLTVNVGSNSWNYQVRDLAEAVASIIPGIEVNINKNAQPDKRSYQVCFDRFASLASDFQPKMDLLGAIRDLRDGLVSMGFQDVDFRNSQYIRLNVLRHLSSKGHLTDMLEWTHAKRRIAA